MELKEIAIKFWQSLINNGKIDDSLCTKSLTVHRHNTTDSKVVTQILNSMDENLSKMDGEIELLEQNENKVISVTKLWFMGTTTHFQVTTFFDFQDNQIQLINEYWTELIK